MKACIIFAHPGDESFNHVLLNCVTTKCDKEGIKYDVRDLYKMGFQPVMSGSDMRNIEENHPSGDVDDEQQLLTEADLLVMIYPVWWWSQPAILKGYIDRVFTDKFAFRYEANGPVGLMRGKQAIVITTTRESEEEMRSKGLDEVVKKQIVDGTLAFMGYDVLYKNFAEVPYVDDAARSHMVHEVEAMLSQLRMPVRI